MTDFAQSVLDTFPKRPIRVMLSPVRSSWLNIVLILVCLGFAGVFVWAEAPGLVRDWKISEAPVAVPDADMTNGRCKTNFVFVDCSATVSYRVAGVSYRSEPSLLFLSFDSYNRASVVRSASKPDLATLDIAVDQLWNRIITFICFVALFTGAGIYSITLIPEARRLTRLVQQKIGISVVPMVVEITRSTSSYGQTTYYFSYDDGGRKRKTQNVMRKDEPFVVGKKGAHALALALLAAHDCRPILLNERLTAIDLTDAERNALWAARDALG